jgi:hypothetical protein
MLLDHCIDERGHLGLVEIDGQRIGYGKDSGDNAREQS